MNGKYQISNDGTIFEIKEDGAITKIARIQNGTVSGISDPPSGEVKSGGKGALWFFLIIFAIAAIVLGILYSQAMEDYESAYRRYDRATRELSELKSELKSVESERDKAQQDLANLRNRIGKTTPLVITDIQIANKYKGGTIETSYGSTIYSSNTMYLAPKITYTGYASGNKTLYVKLFRPSGVMSTGTNSPSGYSYSDTEYIYTGENTCELMSWGNETKGHWESGTYRIEIWYNNSCLKSKSFTIY